MSAHQQDSVTNGKSIYGTDHDWRQRLDTIVSMMREMSRHVDPQVMVQTYRARVRDLLPVDRTVSLSRRDLQSPGFRITRSNLWKEEIDPWKEKDRLPLLEGGMFAELIYANEPRIIDDLQCAERDPAAEYMVGHRSLMAIPLFEDGQAVNMVLLMRKDAAAFAPEILPEWVWASNLFGRAVSNLVLSEKLKQAYETVDHELKVVADIQRSLLPAQLPAILNMDLAAHYETSRRAGGDYYDFFPLPDRKWGILIADVAGHGIPAAVLMAITHSIAHNFPGPPTSPSGMLEHLNRRLACRYINGSVSFVTAFYGIFDPNKRELAYSNAGHEPPRLKRCADGSVLALEDARDLPLGINADESYSNATQSLQPGDQIVFCTDGITEAFDPAGEMFGTQRLDRALSACREDASDLIRAVLDALDEFTAGRPPTDDRTLLLAKIS